MKLFIISENKKVIANITKSITKKGRTLFLAFVRKKTSAIVKIKDNHPDIENERNQTLDISVLVCLVATYPYSIVGQRHYGYWI
ncbi:MAG: hypothetical protein HOI47_01225 [Candidatus Scalindua sp.]|jgi:hypothetical protein|nr:hypothetical protein [Candidatus Scalindua sp.]